jgi:hypothetical protein
MKKVSLDFDKVVVHILTTVYTSHYNQCDNVNEVATCEICVSQQSPTLIGCSWIQTKMLCPFV